MKKILYNQCLIPSVMDGTKTKTRRFIKPQPDEDGLAKFIPTGEWHDTDAKVYIPRYQVGEVVYVGEAWTDVYGSPVYKIDHAGDFRNPGWKSPMFMPESAARTFLKITDVRAERICDISEEDCIAEGIIWFEPLKGFCSPHDNSVLHDTARSAFFDLIRYVNKGKAVDINQWVWVYTFELTEKPEYL